jgi:hypothetical protein
MPGQPRGWPPTGRTWEYQDTTRVSIANPIEPSTLRLLPLLTCARLLGCPPAAIEALRGETRSLQRPLRLCDCWLPCHCSAGAGHAAKRGKNLQPAARVTPTGRPLRAGGTSSTKLPFDPVLPQRKWGYEGGPAGPRKRK